MFFSCKVCSIAVHGVCSRQHLNVCQQLFLLQRPRELELSFGLIYVFQSPFNGTFTRCFYKILTFDILVA